MKLGIIGTGRIVKEALYAIRPLKEIEVKAIFARPHSLEKGRAIAEAFQIGQVCTDYQKLLTGAGVDTVYIGLVNSAHYEYAKIALENGINVILEKPFTATFEEAAELIRTARSKRCFIFEAVTVLHNDVIVKMRETLPKLGRLRLMQANYSQYSSRYDSYLAGIADPSLDPEFYGGALRDINLYNIHYAAFLLGTPERVAYYPNTGFNGVDTSGILIMEYEGHTAVCTGAKDSDSPCFVCIQGEKGYMRIDGKPNVASNLSIVLASDDKEKAVRDEAGATVRPTETEVFIPPADHHRMTGEFRDFARMIDNKEYGEAESYMRETLDVMHIISGLRYPGGGSSPDKGPGLPVQ